MYNPQNKNSLSPVAQPSQAVVNSKNKNIYFYDYKNLIDIIQQIKSNVKQYKSKEDKRINNKNREINAMKTNNDEKTIQKSSQEHGLSPPTLFRYLRNNFDTKTLVYNFGRCLFDFCATTEQSRNKLRQIVREKLKLEVGEKDGYGFKLEVQRQLQKFIDDYEIRSGQVLENNIDKKVIPISKGLFSKKKSKREILADINLIKEIITKPKSPYQQFNEIIEQNVLPLLEIYKKYNIIDNSLIQKINNLRNKIKQGTTQNITSNKGNKLNKYKEEKFKEITEMLRPYQKKFLDSVINKNIRHKNTEYLEKIQNKNKKIVNITNIPTPLKKSKYIVIENEKGKPVNYIKYKTNIPIVQSR